MTETEQLKQVVTAVIGKDMDQANKGLHDLMVAKMRDRMAQMIPNQPPKED